MSQQVYPDNWAISQAEASTCSGFSPFVQETQEPVVLPALQEAAPDRRKVLANCRSKPEPGSSKVTIGQAG